MSHIELPLAQANFTLAGARGSGGLSIAFRPLSAAPQPQ